MTSQQPANEPIEQTPVFAGLARRLLAGAYDLMLLVAVLIVATGLIMPISRGAINPGNPVFQLYLMTVIYLFYTWFWVHGGQTLGMRAWKLRVELDNGRTPGWPQASLRFALGLLTFGFGLFWCLWDHQKRALHDRLARTRVIRVDAP